jgi:hypothetical protein
MFYIIEKLKGSPDVIKGGLLFASDEVYDYFILGCKTPLITISSYYTSPRQTDKWTDSAQKYTVDDFIKQVRAISKREKIVFHTRQFENG